MMNAMSARSIGDRVAKRSPAFAPYAATNSASCQLTIAVVDTCAAGAIDLEQALPRHELRLNRLELLGQPRRRVGLAAQAAAADGAAAERERQPRLVELGEDGLLDLVERHAPPGGAELHLIEGAGNLADARRPDTCCSCRESDSG